MKRLKRSILYSALALMPLSMASAYPFNDPTFQDYNVEDGESIPSTGLWALNEGEAAITNPADSQFYGEAGDGAHNNTIALKNDAKISQFVFREGIYGGAIYTLSFDVGYAIGQTPLDYTVKVANSRQTAMEVLNPVRLQREGNFERVKLIFTNRETITGMYTMSIETQGTGELHFDNFSLLRTSQNTDSPHLRTVAYGNSLYSAANNSHTCTATYSLGENDGNQTAYLTSGEGDCQCVNSKTMEMSETYYPSGDIRTFYQCKMGSN